MRLTQT